MSIFLAGHKGLVGSAILRKLKKKNYKKIITISRKNLDLLDQKAVNNFLKKKNQKLLLLQLQKLEVFTIIILTALILFTRICKYKII